MINGIDGAKGERSWRGETWQVIEHGNEPMNVGE